MSLKIGIVGLPNVGKSTLFKALTKKEVEIANYPFATIDPHVGVVHVPDERLEKLAMFSHSQKKVPAAIEFVDIAGLVKGAAEGEGLGNAFLSHIKEVDVITEVIRVFKDDDIIHVAGGINPVSDIETLEYELILKDLENFEKRLEGAHAGLKRAAPNAATECKLIEHFITELKKGIKCAEIDQKQFVDSEQEILQKILKEIQPLTAKPIIYVLNTSEEQIKESWQPPEELKEKIGTNPYVSISAQIESEISALSDDERKEYLNSYNLQESGLDQLIRVGYHTLGLITFLTTGEDETRAWTIPAGSRAPRAGRAVHSDFEEKFIRAEVINWQTLLNTGSWAIAREKGLLRIEGKEYIVQDGDVIEFKI